MASILCTWYNVSVSSRHSFCVSRIAVGVSFDKKGLLETVHKVTISEFLHNLLLVSYGDNEIKKSKKLCIGLEIRPQTALISLRFVQTAANSSDKRSKRGKSAC